MKVQNVSRKHPQKLHEVRSTRRFGTFRGSAESKDSSGSKVTFAAIFARSLRPKAPELHGKVRPEGDVESAERLIDRLARLGCPFVFLEHGYDPLVNS
jgi:hypothetical protein